MSEKRRDLTNELSRVRVQHAAGTAVSDDLMLITGARERLAKLSKMTRLYKESSTTHLTAPFLTPPTERNDLKNRFEPFTLENQCALGQTAEAKELGKKLADPKRTDKTAKITLKGRKRKRPTAANNLLIALEAELADAKATHAPLVIISARSVTDAAMARADLENCKYVLSKLSKCQNWKDSTYMTLESSP